MRVTSAGSLWRRGRIQSEAKGLLLEEAGYILAVRRLIKTTLCKPGLVLPCSFMHLDSSLLSVSVHRIGRRPKFKLGSNPEFPFLERTLHKAPVFRFFFTTIAALRSINFASAASPLHSENSFYATLARPQRMSSQRGPSASFPS
jgi:hypothetical protein